MKKNHHHHHLPHHSGTKSIMTRLLMGEPSQNSWNRRKTPSQRTLSSNSTARRGTVEGSYVEEFSNRIIFISMSNDIEVNRAGNEEMCINSAQAVADVSNVFPAKSSILHRDRSEQSWKYDSIADTRGKWTRPSRR